MFFPLDTNATSHVQVHVVFPYQNGLTRGKSDMPQGNLDTVRKSKFTQTVKAKQVFKYQEIIIKSSYTTFNNSESYMCLWSPLVIRDKNTFKKLQAKFTAEKAKFVNNSTCRLKVCHLRTLDTGSRLKIILEQAEQKGIK